MNSCVLGKNIKRLRLAFSETQEDLGRVVNVDHNTISSYEKGIRTPPNDILSALARHFMVSVDDLTTIDLVGYNTEYHPDPSMFSKKIDMILPIISSDDANADIHFKRAYKKHKEMYERVKRLDEHCFDQIDRIFKEYEQVTDEKAKLEADTNMVALIYLLRLCLLAPEFIKESPATMLQAIKQGSIRQQDLSMDDFPKDIGKCIDDLNSSDVDDFLQDTIKRLKHSPCWADLGDYYLMFPYFYRVIKVNASPQITMRIGIEMMNALISVDNQYAVRLMLFSLASVGITTPQMVEND